MEPLYVIGEIKLLDTDKINEIKRSIDFALPTDYLTFLAAYGYGDINGFLLVQQPDPDYVKLNFGEYMYFWQWEDNQDQKVLNGLTLATTIDGDIVVATSDRQFPITIMPRHSEKPVSFKDWESMILHYFGVHDFTENLYFDTSYNSSVEMISLIENGSLDKEKIDGVYSRFTQSFHSVRVFNADTQPKHVIQRIGGWVCFDLVYKSSVRVKYQTQFQETANELIAFIKSSMAV
jgi:hypothetical protein